MNIIVRAGLDFEPYREGDAPDRFRDFCCWGQADTCKGCPKLDRNLAQFEQAKYLHERGRGWIHLREQVTRRDKLEAVKLTKPGEQTINGIPGDEPPNGPTVDILPIPKRA